jgi:hypothetical protein
MHRRALRHGLVALLFVAAAGAAAFAWSVDQQLSRLATTGRTTSSRFDALVQAIARFDAAQQLFEPGREPEADWLTRVRRLFTQIETDAKGLHGSTESAPAARAFDDVTERVASAVAKAEENLRDGHDLMAADLLQDEAKPGAEAMRAAVLEWRAAEDNATGATRATLVHQLWMVFGGTAALWAIGVLLLAPRQALAAQAAPGLSILPEPAGEAAISAPVEPAPIEAPAPVVATPSVDLIPAAELCADIARADSGDALAALVDRAARVIGASGLVIWLEGSDEALVPALAHGYGPHAQGLLGRLPLSDENATTRAWHSGALQWVDGSARSRAALAAPMFQGPRRTGVLAVELADGVVASPLTRALTSILAAQFATAVSPQTEHPATEAPSEALEATGS